MSDEPEVNMDNLWEQGLDTDALTQARADLLMPEGSYVTQPSMTLDFNDQEDEYTGRAVGQVARLYGRVEMVVTRKMIEAAIKKNKPLPEGTKIGDVIARGSIGFRVSPMRKNAKDQDGRDLGRPDRAYQLWINAVDAYKKASGGKDAPSNTHVLAFLRDHQYGVRVTQYNVQRFDKAGNPTGREPNGPPGNNVATIFALEG